MIKSAGIFRRYIQGDLETQTPKEILMSLKTAFSVLVVLVCCASLVVPSSAQHFQEVKGSLAGISAGRNEIFGFDSNAAVWRFNLKTNAFSKIKQASLFHAERK